MGNESAIIVPAPEVEPVVGPLRLQFDMGARLGIPAHITLLYPCLLYTSCVHYIVDLVAARERAAVEKENAL